MPEVRFLNKIILLLAVILLPCLVSAETPEYRDYTVVKGDTLWDIAHNELNDPFLWPKVWKENPEIKNPDRIYPGQTIKIPLYLLQKQIVPEIKPPARPATIPELPKEKPVEKMATPVQREDLISRNVLVASGYIADAVHSVGEITESQTGRTELAKGDYAYVKTDRPVKKGDKFYLVRVVEKVVHPVTGRQLGYLIEFPGVAEVENQDRDEYLIKITRSFMEVPVGSLLYDYYEVEPPLAPEHPREPNVNGYIVATRQLHEINGTWDIVYLDKGRSDGLEIGDLLATIRQGRHRVENGTVQIINLRETTATAIIRKSKIETRKGDGVTGVTQQ